MAYEPLHHKYRPQTFSDLVGQKTIALTLSNALTQNRIAPAYLFTGPRGTGKTSSARILAKSLNCLAVEQPTPHPCGKCEACLSIAKGSALDVMEIDAASNTGVDNIREIIDRSRFAPVQCRYKIYAIDECHMLSTAAFNALLKTLEEPPSQVVFILATTDPQRVLSTIISRCQRFDYRRIPLTEMIEHLRYIADRESIAIADDALTLIAQISNGGLRDAESLLDQLSLLPEIITVEKVWDLVGAVPEQDLLKLLQAINGNDSLGVLQQCRSLLDRGREPLVVLQNLATFYLNLLIAKTAPQHSELTAVTETCWQQLCESGKNWQTAAILRGQQHLKEAETQLKRTTQPRLWLEVTLLGLLPAASDAIAAPSRVINPAPEQVPTPVSPAVNSPTHVVEPQAITPTVANVVPPSSSTAPGVVPTPRPTTPAAPVEPPPVPSSPQVAEPVPAISSVPETSPEPAPATAGQDPAANQRIWSQVVSCLQPPTTQALLKQQCHLVNFDGSSAIVGVSSAKLQKMTQQKIPNIEAAFARVCQQKVRVQLEVAGAKKKLTASSAAPLENAGSEPLSMPSQAANPTIEQGVARSVAPNAKTTTTVERGTEMRVSAPPQHATPDGFNHGGGKNRKDTNGKVRNSNGFESNGGQTGSTPMASTALITEANTESAPSPVLEDSKTFLEADYADSELQQAIENLTQSFEGELVQLDRDDFEDSDEVEEELTALSEPESSTLRSPLIERPDLEEYDDDW